MNDTSLKLMAQMILSTMAGNREKTWELYEQYQREKRLHVTIKEILEWKKEKTA